MKMMMVTSQSGWAVIGDMEQKVGTQKAVLEDLQKHGLIEEHHFQLW